MALRIVIWSGLVVVAVVCGHLFPPAAALLVWSLIALALCGLGVFLISRQPLGQATTGGYVGFCFAHWGYRAGYGLLGRAFAISTLVWIVIGAAVIGIHRSRADALMILLILSWLITALGIMYMVGVVLVARRGGGKVPLSVVKMLAGLTGILVASVLLASVSTSWGKVAALTLTGGPIALIATGYGLFFLVMMTVGRNARWN